MSSIALKKWDSYVLHIEPGTLDKLSAVHDLIFQESGQLRSFDKIINSALGRYMTALKYQAKTKDVR